MSFFEELKRRNVVRVGLAYILIAWLLLQGADFALDLIGAPNWVIQSLFLMAAIGLPGVLIFSWVFEMTPEGLKREIDVDRSVSITAHTSRKLDRVIVSVLFLVVAYLLLDKLVLQDRPEPATEVQATAQTEATAEKEALSVAVLPFVNMSGDPQNEYFSDGLTETLLHMLSQLPELRVAARTSSFAFKGQNVSIGEIASTLGVAHILEGSVQKAGDRVRITAQLVKAEDGFHVWSETYDRTLDDIFAIQDEIARDVASALDASLFGSAQHVMHGVETANITAYDVYLRAMDQQSVFSYGSLAEAEGLFKQALAEDPGFIDAKLGLARNYLMMSGTGILTQDEAMEHMAPLLAQVREEQPGNRLARAFELVLELAGTDVKTKEETDAIVNELRNLLPLIPTESYVRSYVSGQLTWFYEQPNEALEVIEAGLMVDPLSAYLHARGGNVFVKMKDYDKAREYYMRALELDPRDPGTYSRLSDLAWEQGHVAEMLDWMRRAVEVDPQDHELAATLAGDFFDLGLPEEGDRWAARVNALAPGSDIARRVEVVRALSRGEQDRVVEVASAMIADQVSLRQDNFSTATFIFMHEMMRQDRAREAFDFLRSVRPELADFEAMPSDIQGLIMQFAAIHLMTGFAGYEERRDAWHKLVGVMDATGFPWRTREPGNAVLDHVFNGDTAGAIDAALTGELAQPITKNLTITWQYRNPIYSEVIQDPRVKTRLAELEREKEKARDQVREMLMRPEWSDS